jgi:hypothetical protein
MAMLNRKVLSMLAVTVATVTLLDGCGSSRSKEDQALIDSLQTKNGQLQTENEELRRKVQGQEAFKTLMTAMSGRSPDASAATGDSAQPGNPSTTAAASTPIVATVTFTDIDDAAQKSTIQELAQLGVFDTTGDKFEPFKPVSRGEYVTWLFKAHNKMQPDEKQIHLAPQVPPQFKDLKENHPAYKYAQALANAGYSVGYDDGTFRADKPITREEMIGIKVGVDCGKSYDPYPGQMAYVWKFSDAKDVDNRFTGYIHQDYYVSGDKGSNIARAFGKVGTLRPKQPVLRCEAAGTLWQFGQFGMDKANATKALKI